jgi:hypothetical protein
LAPSTDLQPASSVNSGFAFRTTPDLRRAPHPSRSALRLRTTHCGFIRRKRQKPCGVWRSHHDNLAVSRISHLRTRSLTRPPTFIGDLVSCESFDQLPAFLGFESLTLPSVSSRLASDLDFQRFRQPPTDLRLSAISVLPLTSVRLAPLFRLQPLRSTFHRFPPAINLPLHLPSTSESRRIINFCWCSRLTSDLHQSFESGFAFRPTPGLRRALDPSRSTFISGRLTAPRVP